MKRIGLFWVLAMLQACVVENVDSEVSETASSDAYATCAACHLANGVGIPGGFPPIRNRAAAIAGLEDGKAYLITVVSFGLMGQIEAGNMPYFGVMPGNKGPMSVADIAAALNYTVFELVDDKNTVASIDPFTADEVSAVQSNTSVGSPNTAAMIRRELVARHGDKWPE